MSKDHPIVVKMTLKALVITASSIAVLLGVHLVKCQQLEPCTTVSSCDSVAYLISLLDSDDADDNLPMGMTRANVIRTLKSVVCRRERDEDGRLKVFVRCPSADTLQQAVLRQGVTETLIRDNGGCEGSLRIHVVSVPEENGIRVHNFRGRRNDLVRVRGYDPTGVFRVEVFGTCCWKLFPNPFRRGSPETLGIGFDGPVERMFRSITKTDCS